MRFLAALRSTGLTAPLVVDGALLLGYVRQQLVPTLSAGDIVIMDNLAAHKVADGREAIAAGRSWRLGTRLSDFPLVGPPP